MPKYINLLGRKIKDITIIEKVAAPSHIKNKNEIYYKCMCDCGVISICASRSLREGRDPKLNCDCNLKNILKEVIGKKYGRLTALSLAETPEKIKLAGSHKIYINCICICGNTIDPQDLNILKKRENKGIEISCGCAKGVQDPNKAKLQSAKFVWKRSYRDGDITFEKFLEMSQMKCYYCNSDPSTIINIYQYSKNRSNKIERKLNTRFAPTLALENGNFIYNGLDRIDSSKKHNMDNIVTACKKCNYMKLDHSIDDFKSHIENIYNFFCKKEQ